jgi:hypothetical protein
MPWLNYGTTKTTTSTNGGGGVATADDIFEKSSKTETSSLLPTDGGTAAADGGGSSSATATTTTRTATTSDGINITFRTEQSASFLSRLVFEWMAPMMRLGNAKGKLDPADILLIPLPDDCLSDNLSEIFAESWQYELDQAAAAASAGASKSSSSSPSKKRSSEPSLIRALFRAFGTDYIVGGFILKLIHDSW